MLNLKAPNVLIPNSKINLKKAYMNTQQKRLILSIIAIVVVMLLPILASAQFDTPPAEPDVPIDGGLSLLIAGGVGYAAKKIKDRKQAKN